MTKIVKDDNIIPVMKVSYIRHYDLFYGVHINDADNHQLKGYIQRQGSNQKSYSIKFLNGFLENSDLLGYTREINFDKYIIWLLDEDISVYRFNTAQELFDWMTK